MPTQIQIYKFTFKKLAAVVARISQLKIQENFFFQCYGKMMLNYSEILIDHCVNCKSVLLVKMMSDADYIFRQNQNENTII